MRSAAPGHVDPDPGMVVKKRETVSLCGETRDVYIPVAVASKCTLCVCPILNLKSKIPSGNTNAEMQDGLSYIIRDKKNPNGSLSCRMAYAL